MNKGTTPHLPISECFNRQPIKYFPSWMKKTVLHINSHFVFIKSLAEPIKRDKLW